MNSRVLLTAAMRAVMTVGAFGLSAAGLPAPAQAQDPVAQLAAGIQAAVVSAQRDAAAQGLSDSDAAALVQQAVQTVIVASGEPPSVVLAAVAQVRANLIQAGLLSGTANAGLTAAESAVSGGIGTGSGGGGGGGSAIGGTSGGSGGGGGSDYRPVG